MGLIPQAPSSATSGFCGAFGAAFYGAHTEKGLFKPTDVTKEPAVLLGSLVIEMAGEMAGLRSDLACIRKAPPALRFTA